MGKRSQTVKPQSEGFWDKPPLMNMVADLLFLIALGALGYAGAVAFLRLPLFPLTEVSVNAPLREVTAEQIEYATQRAVTGNFFTVNLQAVRAAFEKLPWVRRAEVQRRWPGGLELTIEEQVAAARWKQGEGVEARLVNDRGEVFSATSNMDLPVFSGPEGTAPKLMARYQELAGIVAPLGRKPRHVALSAREAWQMRLDDGVVLQLGRDQPKSPVSDRLSRFVGVYKESIDKAKVRAEVVDLRYPNGFALRPAHGDAKPATVSPAGEGAKAQVVSLRPRTGADKKGKQ